MEIRRERELAERKLMEAAERSKLDITLTKQEAAAECQKLEDVIYEKLREIDELQQRWEGRESRPEDLQRIQQLEQEMIEKDELIVRTREEMLYFKREMLNREENYNQKFNRSPNVGVMQVLKSKDPTSSSSTGLGDSLLSSSSGHKPGAPGGGPKGSSKPSFAVAPGGGSSSSLGIGMGIGMTSSSMSVSGSVGALGTNSGTSHHHNSSVKNGIPPARRTSAM
jgi:hypothetical protein